MDSSPCHGVLNLALIWIFASRGDHDQAGTTPSKASVRFAGSGWNENSQQTGQQSCDRMAAGSSNETNASGGGTLSCATHAGAEGRADAALSSKRPQSEWLVFARAPSRMLRTELHMPVPSTGPLKSETTGSGIDDDPHRSLPVTDSDPVALGVGDDMSLIAQKRSSPERFARLRWRNIFQ
jgi:hypothetical protein